MRFWIAAFVGMTISVVQASHHYPTVMLVEAGIQPILEELNAISRESLL